MPTGFQKTRDTSAQAAWSRLAKNQIIRAKNSIRQKPSSDALPGAYQKRRHLSRSVSAIESEASMPAPPR